MTADLGKPPAACKEDSGTDLFTVLYAQLRRGDGAVADELTDLLAQYTSIERSGYLEGPLPRPAREPTLEGLVVGSYTVDRLLGQGGHGGGVARASQRWPL